MGPFLRFVISIGQWAQEHQTLVIIGSVLVVFLLGGIKLAQHTISSAQRRPRL